MVNIIGTVTHSSKNNTDPDTTAAAQATFQNIA